MQEKLREIKKNELGHGILIEHDAGVIEQKKINIIKEEINASGDYKIPLPCVITAIFQKADTPNANGRIYPRHILEREIKKYIEKIKDGRGIGECDHPENSVISARVLSHNIKNLWWEGKTVVGEMELLLSPGYVKYGIVSTPGDMVANCMIFNNVKLGVSSRGVGSVENKNGVNVVGNDFELICWDIVTDPSTPGSWASTDKNNLSPYIETNTTNVGKKIITEELVNHMDNVISSYMIF